MADKIETIDGTVIQHGHMNNRIYVMQLDETQIGHLIATLDHMARDKGYDKIFAKIPARQWKNFDSAGYTKEAVVPGLFNGKTDGLFIAKYFARQRQRDERLRSFSPNEYVRQTATVTPGGQYPIEFCSQADAADMGALFKQVFSTYPFPIQNTAYLEKMMGAGVRYCCIRMDGIMAALAAMEMDVHHNNCEMTDFATLPEWRGKGLAQILLDSMEKAARRLGVKTAYTIARAASPGMNFVFKNNAYRYGGVLINNSQICGSIESMVVWYKHL